VRPMPVVVIHVFGEHGFEMAAAEDEEPVQALSADRADKPLGDSVRARRPDGCLDDPDPFGGEDGVEGRGELGVPISDEEFGRRRPFRQVVAEVAGLLGHPAGHGAGRDTGEVDPTGVVVDEEQHVETPEQDGVDREEVTGDQTLRLSLEELRPRWPRPSRCRVDAPTLQDRPDARWGDGDAHAGELAMDAPVAPSRILLGQPDDESDGACGNHWPSRAAMRVGPASADEISVPAQQRGWLDEEPSATRSWEKS